jgi:para-aminobenzoate synthetase
MPSRTPPELILFVDAYDSFSNNIISMLETNLDNVEVTTVTIDFRPPTGWPIYLSAFTAVVIGPGPGSPLNDADIGCIKDILEISDDYRTPVLGICLGFQSICLRYGGKLARLQQPRHGIVHEITHNDGDVFAGVGLVKGTLYNSLCIRLGLPAEMDASLFDHSITSKYWRLDEKKGCSLEPLAWAMPIGDGFGKRDGAVLMAVKAADLPIWGLQFHPESCYSNAACLEIIKNWWTEVKACSKLHGRQFEPVWSAHSFSRTMNRYKPELRNEISSLKLQTLDTVPEDPINPLNTLTENISDKPEWTTVDLSGDRDTQVLTVTKVLEICDVPQRNVVVLESRAANGRYTIISIDSPGTFRLEHNAAEPTYRIIKSTGDLEYEIPEAKTIFDLLSYVMAKRRRTGGHNEVPFWGGFMGFFGYNIGREKWMTEPRTYHEDEKFRKTDMALLWVERSIVIDHLKGLLHFQSIRADDGTWLATCPDRFLSYLSTPSPVDAPYLKDSKSDPIRKKKNSMQHSSHTQSLTNDIVKSAKIHEPNEQIYKDQIRLCQSHNASGTSYELCLTASTTISIPSPRPSDPYYLYLSLRSRTPSRYAAFLTLSGLHILSASPERFLAWSRDQVFEMRPMKGTVKKEAGMTFEKAKQILETRKEVAENLMIADLIRHDMHGVVGSGNVHVEKLMLVEEHARVYQMVTVVKGSLPQLTSTASTARRRDGNGRECLGVKMLHSCLAPGSMTGAPKKRSMELLDEIEDRDRGIYSGVLGYLDIGGGGDWSVIIRSAFRYPRRENSHAKGESEPDIWRVGAGGAVTTLSTVDGEWEEMRAKLETVLGVFRPKEETEESWAREEEAIDASGGGGRGGAGEGWGLV